MKIQVILGSVRPGRNGARVATWVMSRLAEQPGVEAELLDLKDYPLPFYDEELLPVQLHGAYKSEVARQWAAKIPRS